MSGIVKTGFILTGLITLYAVVGEQDYQHAKELEAKRARWLSRVEAACLPNAIGQVAITDFNQDGSLRCRILTNTGYGRAPKTVSNTTVTMNEE